MRLLFIAPIISAVLAPVTAHAYGRTMYSSYGSPESATFKSETSGNGGTASSPATAQSVTSGEDAPASVSEGERESDSQGEPASLEK